MCFHAEIVRQCNMEDTDSKESQIDVNEGAGTGTQPNVTTDNCAQEPSGHISRCQINQLI
jgi:hypothetical protein